MRHKEFGPLTPNLLLRALKTQTGLKQWAGRWPPERVRWLWVVEGAESRAWRQEPWVQILDLLLFSALAVFQASSPFLCNTTQACLLGHSEM